MLLPKVFKEYENVRLSMLEDCASYLDGTIYNLEAKVTNFDENESIIQMMLQNQANPLN